MAGVGLFRIEDRCQRLKILHCLALLSLSFFLATEQGCVCTQYVSER